MWLVAITALILYMLLTRVPETAPKEAPDEVALAAEMVRAKATSLMRRTLLSLPLVSTSWMLLSPVVAPLYALLGPHLQLLLATLNRAGPALRKLQRAYVFVFWSQRLREWQLASRCGRLLGRVADAISALSEQTREAVTQWAHRLTAHRATGGTLLDA